MSEVHSQFAICTACRFYSFTGTCSGVNFSIEHYKSVLEITLFKQHPIECQINSSSTYYLYMCISLYILLDWCVILISLHAINN